MNSRAEPFILKYNYQQLKFSELNPPEGLPADQLVVPLNVHGVDQLVVSVHLSH